MFKEMEKAIGPDSEIIGVSYSDIQIKELSLFGFNWWVSYVLIIGPIRIPQEIGFSELSQANQHIDALNKKYGARFQCQACEIRPARTPASLCEPCLDKAEFDNQTPEFRIIGYLIEGQFYCEDCIDWYNDCEITPVHRIHIGIYSQACCSCHKVVVRGSTACNLFNLEKPKARW